MGKKIQIPINKEFPFALSQTNLIPLYIGSKNIPLEVYDAITYTYEKWYIDNKLKEYKLKLVRNNTFQIIESYTSKIDGDYIEFDIKLSIDNDQFLLNLRDNINKKYKFYIVSDTYNLLVDDEKGSIKDIDVSDFKNYESSYSIDLEINMQLLTKLNAKIKVYKDLIDAISDDKNENENEKRIKNFLELYLKSIILKSVLEGGTNKRIEIDYFNILKYVYHFDLDKNPTVVKDTVYSYLERNGFTIYKNLKLDDIKQLSNDLYSYVNNCLLNLNKKDIHKYAFRSAINIMNKNYKCNLDDKDFKYTNLEFIYNDLNFYFNNFPEYGYDFSDMIYRKHCLNKEKKISNWDFRTDDAINANGIFEEFKNIQATKVLNTYDFNMKVSFENYYEISKNYNNGYPIDINNEYLQFNSKEIDNILYITFKQFIMDGFIKNAYPELYKELQKENIISIQVKKYLNEYNLLNSSGEFNIDVFGSELNKYLQSNNSNKIFNMIYLQVLKTALNKPMVKYGSKFEYDKIVKQLESGRILIPRMVYINKVKFDNNTIKLVDFNLDTNVFEISINFIIDLYLTYDPISLKELVKYLNDKEYESESDRKIETDRTSINTNVQMATVNIDGNWEKLQPTITSINPKEVIDYNELNKILTNASPKKRLAIRAAYESFIANFRNDGMPIVVKSIPVKAKETDEEISKLIIEALNKNNTDPWLTTLMKDLCKKTVSSFKKWGKKLLRWSINILTLSLYHVYLKKYKVKEWDTSIKTAILENDGNHKPGLVVSIDQFNDVNWELDINKLNLFFKYGWGNIFIIDSYNERIICLIKMGFGSDFGGYATIIPFHGIRNYVKNREDVQKNSSSDLADILSMIGAKSISLNKVSKVVRQSIHKKGV